jgi:hypothetical protein
VTLGIVDTEAHVVLLSFGLAGLVALFEGGLSFLRCLFRFAIVVFVDELLFTTSLGVASSGGIGRTMLARSSSPANGATVSAAPRSTNSPSPADTASGSTSKPPIAAPSLTNICGCGRMRPTIE